MLCRLWVEAWNLNSSTYSTWIENPHVRAPDEYEYIGVEHLNCVVFFLSIYSYTTNFSAHMFPAYTHFRVFGLHVTDENNTRRTMFDDEFKPATCIVWHHRMAWERKKQQTRESEGK